MVRKTVGTMVWRKPNEELPKEGDTVLVLMQHWKEHGPLSCEIFCGEAAWNNGRSQLCAWNNDWIGAGSARWTIWQHEDCEYPSDNVAVAWVSASDFVFPNWLPRKTGDCK